MYAYGLMLAVAVFVGSTVAGRYVVTKRIDPDTIVNLVILLVIGGVIGARLVYVLVEWCRFASNPWNIIRLWDGGLAFYGAVIAALPIISLYSRVTQIRFGELADAVALGAAAGYPFARIGCFLNGCCYGLPSDLPWAVTFADGVHRHPTQLYSALIGVLIYLALRHLLSYRRFPGHLSFYYLIFYGLYRFIMDFFRVSPPATSLLTITQVASLTLVGVTFMVLIAKLRFLRQQSP